MHVCAGTYASANTAKKKQPPTPPDAIYALHSAQEDFRNFYIRSVIIVTYVAVAAVVGRIAVLQLSLLLYILI